jgi:hypothetical protein
MVNTRLTRRGMSEESALEEARTSYDPQAEIVRLNEKIVQLEKDLQIRDQTEQQKTEKEQPHNSHASEENENRNVEETVGDESSIDGDTELANLLRENEREKKEWAEKLTKLEQQYDLLVGSSQSHGKGKASLADSLFSNTSSPFTDQIMSYRLPDKFQMPDIPVYTRLGDPIEHLASFCAHTVLHATPDEVACRAFPLTLAKGARDWFRALPSRSVTSFESLAKKFASQFMAGIVRKKLVQQLMSIKQGPQESLRSYLLRFNQERLATESQSKQFIHCTIYQGTRKDGALMADLARKPAEGLQEFLDRAEEFVNQEETLRAFRGVERTSGEGMKRRKN